MGIINSVIALTKEKIESLLTGEISSHTHAAIPADKNTDGGFANSTYLPSQNVDGGTA